MSQTPLQQNCCCPKWHPCCVSYDALYPCMQGEINNCETSSPPIQIPIVVRKEFIAHECYQSDEECKQAYNYLTNVEASLYTDYFCFQLSDGNWYGAPPPDSSFCRTLPRGIVCSDYECDECGPISVGCSLRPNIDFCPPPPDCTPAECCNPPPPRFCCCVTVENNNAVSSTCTPLGENEECAPPAGGLTGNATQDEGGVAALTSCGLCASPPDTSLCGGSCIKWHGVRQYKICTSGHCDPCPNPNCPAAEAQCCNTWVTEVSQQTKCVGSYVIDCDPDPRLSVSCTCKDGYTLDSCTIPSADLFDNTPEWEKRCGPVKTFWVSSGWGELSDPNCAIKTGILKSECGAQFPPITETVGTGMCIGGSSTSCTDASLVTISSPTTTNQQNVYCQLLATGGSLPANWYTTAWGKCDCTGNSPMGGNTALANALCNCCGCPPDPGNPKKKWGCADIITPPPPPGGGSGGGAGSNPWGGGGWGGGSPPGGGKGDGEGGPIPNGTYCFTVEDCTACEAINNEDPSGNNIRVGVSMKCVKPQDCDANCGCAPGTVKFDTGNMGKMAKNANLIGILEEQTLSASDVKIRVEYIADFLDSADSNDPRGNALVFFNDILVMNVNQGPYSIALDCPGEAWNSQKTLTIEEWAAIVNDPNTIETGVIDVRIECDELLGNPCTQGRTIVYVSYVSAEQIYQVDVETGNMGALAAGVTLEDTLEEQQQTVTSVAMWLVATADMSEDNANVKLFLNDANVATFTLSDARTESDPPIPPPPCDEGDGYYFFKEIPISLWNNAVIANSENPGEVKVRVEANDRLSEDPCNGGITNLYIRYVATTSDEIFPPCAAWCPTCGGPCVPSGAESECCTIDGGCNSYSCACQTEIVGICTAPATSPLTGLGYRFSQKNKSLEDNLTIGYAYDIYGNVIRNDIFLFGYGTSFL